LHEVIDLSACFGAASQLGAERFGEGHDRAHGCSFVQMLSVG
jgi:hypothetical protein